MISRGLRTFASIAFIVLLTSAAQAQSLEEYEYDALGRLISVDNDDDEYEIAYEYDSVGNRSSVTTSLGVSFSVDDVSVSEGGDLVFTITKTGVATGDTGVSYATANGTATAGSDYTAKSGTLSFAAAQTTKTVSVATIEDSVYESGETVKLDLSAPTGGAVVADDQGIGTITNDDPAPAFSVNNVSVSEGGNLVFTVTKSGVTSKTHNVSYATANGTASSNDYTSKSGALTFTSSQTSKTISVPTTEDSTYEPNETVKLNLSNATNGATISDSQGVGTINNDDTNQPPNAANDNAGTVVLYETKYVYPLTNDSDPEDDPITLTDYSEPVGVVVDWNASLERMSIASGTSGTKNISYTISDGSGGTDTATVTIDVEMPTCGGRVC